VTFLLRVLIKLGILRNDLDYHLLRDRWSSFFSPLAIRNGSIMRRRLCSPTSVTALSSFGCTQSLAFGGNLFRRSCKWLLALLFAGYWNKRLGILEALGSCFTFIATTTIIPFMPDGWAASAGGFPAMTEKVAFPDEGSRPFRCVCLFTAAGRDKGFAVQDVGIRLKHHSSAGRKSDGSSRRLIVLSSSGGMNVSRRLGWLCLEFSWRR
jgi:hypothetical protein